MNTKEERIERMRKLADEADEDREDAHALADDLLCEALMEYGEKELVDLFTSFDKWYA